MRMLCFVLGLVLILSFGCSNTPPITTADSTENVVLHPENYEGQEVTILASPEYLVMKPSSGFQWYTSVEDIEGKPIRLYLNYSHFYCEDCTVTGTVCKAELCDCEILMAGDNWDGYDGYTAEPSYLRADLCEEESKYLERRCNPDGESTEIYYLDVRKVVKVD